MRMALVATATVCIIAVPSVGQSQAPSEPAPNVQRQRSESRMRIMRLVGLAEALGIDEAQALRLNETMRSYDERRIALETENSGLARVVKRAADGDAAALGQVDQALQRMFDNRAEIQQLNRQMIEAASRQLSSRQRAQMAVFFATFGDELREMHRRSQERARQEALKSAVERARSAK